MKTIVFDIPKKVRKKIQLEDVKLPINRAPSVLGLVKEFSIENKTAITVGISIIDSEGEEEIEEEIIIKENNSSNLLLILREALYSEKYSEFPSQPKEEFLQEVEKDLNIPIETSNISTKQNMKQTTEKSTVASKKKFGFKSFKLSNTQLFILIDTFAAVIFLVVIGYPRLGIGVLLLSLIINSSYVVLKQREYPGEQFRDEKEINTEDFLKNELLSNNQDNGNDNFKITGGRKPTIAQREEIEPSMSTEEAVTQQEAPTFRTQEPGFEEDQKKKRAEYDELQVEAQKALNVLKAIHPSSSITETPDDFPSQQVEEKPVPKEESYDNVSVAHKTPSKAVKIDEDRFESEPVLPVLERERGAFPTLKAGNAEANHLYNLERLDRQISLLIEKEFEVIKEKQALVDQLEINNHSDAMKARVSIEELYQLQSAFEKKWTVA